MDGFLLINKEKDWTSRDVCNKVQSIFNLPKVGHIGTLDPFATGLLMVSIGKGTKAGRFIENLDKTYIATLVLGKKTDTGDLTGNIIQEEEYSNYNDEYIQNVLNSFIGEIDQVPPMSSAVHYKGQKLYSLLHQGIVVTPPSRKVRINKVKLLIHENNIISFSVNVSKGTYIRTLGESIAEKLGTVGYLSYLHRISIGNLSIRNAHTLSEVKEEHLISISDALIGMDRIVVDEEIKKKAMYGVNLSFNCDKNTILIVDKNSNAISVYEKEHDNIYVCVRGLF